jgi:5'(3')-deoxyribonucleotidase
MSHLERYNPLAAGHVEPVDYGAHRLWRITEAGKQDEGCIQALIAMGYRQTIGDLWEHQGERSEEKPKNAKDLIALIDMDGTVADFDGAMLRELKRIASPGEPELIGPDGRYVDSPYISARRRLIRNQPGFWRSLPTYAPGFEIMSELKTLGFRCHILTKGPAREAAGWTEKVEWCRRHLPDTPVIIAEEKSLVYGRILVDDWSDYFLPWLEHRPRGLVIAPAHPWNKDITHPQVVRYDGTNLDEVRDRLHKAAGQEDEP